MRLMANKINKQFSNMWVKLRSRTVLNNIKSSQLSILQGKLASVQHALVYFHN